MIIDCLHTDNTDLHGCLQADGGLGRIMITDSSDWTDVRLLPCISRKNKKGQRDRYIDPKIADC